MIFGDAGEKIEGDGTDLTITSSAALNLSAGTDVVLPINIGLHFTDANEKIESNGTNLTITAASGVIALAPSTDVTLPNDKGMIFGDAGEKIEGDGTDLTISSSNKLNLGATTDVHLANDIGLIFGDAGEKIEGDGTNLLINSSALCTITAVGNTVVTNNAIVSGNLTVSGNLDVTGTLDLSDSNFTNVGSLQLDSIAGDGDTNTSITFSGSDVITVATGGAGRITFKDGALSPVTNNQIDLGTTSLEFKNAFFDGTVTSDAFAGPLTGNVTGTADVATVATTVTITDNESTNENNAMIFTAGGDIDGGNLGLESDGTCTYNPSTGKITATGFIGNLTGTASAANYSDVAERFASDSNYEEGTVVTLGGAEEITITTEEASDDVFGVVSSVEQAAFKMNSDAGSDSTHPYIAMTGRVWVKITGVVNKGDRLISSATPGHARAATKAECTAFNVLGRALEFSDAGRVKAAVRVSH